MSKFQRIEVFRKPKHGYQLLPFRFTTLEADRYVLTNLAGEYVIASGETLRNLVSHQLREGDPAYVALRSRHFIVDHEGSVAPELLAMKVRTRHSRLAEFTGLHMFVVTLRCEHSCPYCQVSRRSEDKLAFDMSRDAAARSIELAFSTPSETLKIEFQGGEPLLNFDLIKFVVEQSERVNASKKKQLAFVIATNLALVTEEILEYCRDHSILISTSLDGPKGIHNRNRPRPGGDSYERTTEGIRLAKRMLGADRVSALMTTTAASLDRPKEIIDEYLSQGFGHIFLRPLSPYGFAVKTKSIRAYDAERWLKFYKEGLDYIIELNREGIDFTEHYSALILKKMLTSEDPGYVDLMSPAGIGLGAVVYNYDGDIYASDEGRMLAEMGDRHFRIGNVFKNTYSEIFTHPNLLDALEESFAYSAPMCNDCAFEPYCGSDPVYHHAVHRDLLGRKPESEFCRRNMAICRYLIQRMDGDKFVRRLFTRWANR